MTFTSCLLACCTLITTPNKTWLQIDQESLDHARVHCKQEYQHSPCLIKFKKVEDSIYTAVCGGSNK